MEIGYLGAFLMGLFGALHCVGMCGSIMGVLTFSLPRETRQHAGRLLGYLGYYNFGRIISYCLAGSLAGAFGSGLLLRVSPQYGHSILLLFATILMVAVGFYLAGWFPGLAHIERAGAPIWRKLEPLGRKLLPVKSPLQALLYGLIWGWLPCGLVYSALFIALGQGSAFQGAVFMLLFGLGTLPAVVTTGVFADQIMRIARNPRMRIIAGIALIVFALTGLIVNW
ncbi:sulfite exporter TauE/SafE family protein [Thiolapillus sp.]